MRVTLYRYIGDSDTANKLLKSNTIVFDKEVIPYGSFDPAGATFRLDVLLDVNYAKFTYNSHDYYGYVDVSTDSKGIYSYKITTDPLTTAWYAGCFNVGQYCKYSDYGTLLIKDPRTTDESENTWLVKTFNPTAEYITAVNDWYVVTVLNATLENQSNKTNNPIFSSFAMSGTVFNDFTTKFQTLTGEQQYKFAPSIVAVYSIRSYEMTSLNWLIKCPTSKVVRLHSLTAVGADGTVTSIESLDINLSSDSYRIDTKFTGQTFLNSAGGYSIDTTTNGQPIVATPSNLDAQFVLHIPDSGDMKFSLRNIIEYTGAGASYSISKIGYRKYYDFISGMSKAYLVINDTTVLPQYSLTASLPIKLPILYDASLQDWKATKNSLLTSGIGFAGSVAATIAAGAATIASGGAAAPALIAAGSSLVGVGTSLAGAVNSFKHQEFVDENATASTVCGSGGSVDFPEKPWLIAWYHRSHNIADVQGKFGKPDGLVRVVGNLKGWVQTESCHLPSNGLPFDLISQAEKLSDAGFRIEE